MQKGIRIKCPKCGEVEELSDFAGWSFIIMKDTKCDKCGTTITHDDVIDD